MKVNRIFIMLGNLCNLNCKYCLQHPLMNTFIGSKISPNLYDFLYNYKFNKNVRITFYGGEPLLYFPVIKEIVYNLPANKFNFGIISNGKLLNQEIVDFCNNNHMGFALSWDGRNSNITRGYNAIEDKKELIYQLEGLFLTGVMTPYSYPKELLEDFSKVYDEYKAIHRIGLGINIDLIMDTGLHNKELLEFDYDKLEKEMNELITMFDEKDLNYMNSNVHPVIHQWIQKLAIPYNQYKAYGTTNTRSKCGNGYSVANIDLKGNLYPCHNTSTSIGTYDSYNNLSWSEEEYNKKIKDGDLVINRLQTTCKDCKVRYICKGGCKLVTDLSNFCKLRKAIYGPIIDYLNKRFYTN